MKRTPVKSDNIVSVGYDPENSVLQVEFKSGGVYDYKDVPQSRYDELMAARSKGSFFHGFIKNSFEWKKADAI